MALGAIKGIRYVESELLFAIDLSGLVVLRDGVSGRNLGVVQSRYLPIPFSSYPSENRSNKKGSFSKSGYHGDKHECRGPYASETSVTLARELLKEIKKRHNL